MNYFEKHYNPWSFLLLQINVWINLRTLSVIDKTINIFGQISLNFCLQNTNRSKLMISHFLLLYNFFKKFQQFLKFGLKLFLHRNVSHFLAHCVLFTFFSFFHLLFLVFSVFYLTFNSIGIIMELEISSCFEFSFNLVQFSSI